MILGETMAIKTSQPSPKPPAVWDLPLRVFHWMLALSVFAAIGTAKNGAMYWHEKAGLTILGLLVFRLIWGVIGGHHARFQHFMTSPQRAIEYLREGLREKGERPHQPGHAPTGAYATIAIIAVLSMMVGFGLMANDDVLYEGPLAAFVGASFSDTARFWHHNLEKAVFLLIALHLLAIAIYRFRFQVRLIPAMVHGGEDQSIPAISKSRQIFGLILLALLIAASQSLSLLGDRFF